MVSNRFSLGDYVVDSEADTKSPAVVLNMPPQRADEWNAYRNTTVADDNPDYDSGSVVVVVAFVDDILEQGAEEYLDIGEPVPIKEIHEYDIKDYAFPDGRMAFFAGEIPGIGRIDPPEEADKDEIFGERAPDSDSTDDSESVEEPEPEGEASEQATDDKLPESEGEDEDEDPTPPIPDSLQPVATRLDDNDVEYDVGEESLLIQKIGQVYEIHPDRTITGDGLHRDQIAEIVENAPDAESADDE